MLHSFPEIDPDALLTREETAQELTLRGFKVSYATLASNSIRNGGPPFQKFGRYVRYRWGPTLEWARKRMGSPVVPRDRYDSRQLPEWQQGRPFR